LITRGQTRAMRWIEAIARRVPLVNPETISALLQKLADRLHILLRDRALLRHAILWAALNWLLDAASLWVFLFAFDQSRPVFPIDLLVAYGLANILAVIPITPSGLGVVEGVLIPTLVGFHVPKTFAILGVISYRLINFWLPIPVGGISYLSLRWGSRAKRVPPATAQPAQEPLVH
jgi:putative heme transporter